MTRSSVTQFMTDVALAAARRSTCTSRVAVGAVLADRYNRVVATGYNGAPARMPHCDDVGCIHDRDGHCISAVHAEVNAVVQCARTGQSSMGLTCYSTHSPCPRCTAVLVQAGVAAIYFLKKYGDIHLSVMICKEAGLIFQQIEL